MIQIPSRPVKTNATLTQDEKLKMRQKRLESVKRQLAAAKTAIRTSVAWGVNGK